MVTDIVLVLDKSTSAALENQALEMLAELKTQTENTGAAIKTAVEAIKLLIAADKAK